MKELIVAIDGPSGAGKSTHVPLRGAGCWAPGD